MDYDEVKKALDVICYRVPLQRDGHSLGYCEAVGKFQWYCRVCGKPMYNEAFVEHRGDYYDSVFRKYLWMHQHDFEWWVLFEGKVPEWMERDK